MESNVVYGYYLSRQAKLLKEFQNIADAVKPFLIERYGIELTQTLIAEATHQYEMLILEIPYINTPNPCRWLLSLRFPVYNGKAHKDILKNS